jgi:hypothetical protein
MKRMINRLHLLVAIAAQREMIGGEPPLEPEHLGKWAALNERWPAAAAEIRHDPGGIARREIRSSAPETGVRSSDERELKAFFTCGPPLRDVVERLVYYRRAVPDPDEPSASATEPAGQRVPF